MPRETFLNLPASKREQVEKAITSEFLSVPYEKVSIKNIVEMAGIPRGSFYQYFDDKEDALRYLIAQSRDISEIEIINERENIECDIFDFLKLVFIRELNNYKKGEMTFKLRLFSKVAESPYALMVFNDEIKTATMKSAIFNKYWDKAGFGKLTESEHSAILDLFTSTLKESLTDLIQNKEYGDQVLTQFELKFNIIKNGIAILFNK